MVKTGEKPLLNTKFAVFPGVFCIFLRKALQNKAPRRFSCAATANSAAKPQCWPRESVDCRALPRDVFRQSTAIARHLELPAVTAALCNPAHPAGSTMAISDAARQRDDLMSGANPSGIHTISG
jgi:hypothetical protein